jgi:hypothetical protein
MPILRKLQIGLLAILLFVTPFNIQTVYGATVADIKAETEEMITEVKADHLDDINADQKKQMNDFFRKALNKFNGIDLNGAMAVKNLVQQRIDAIVKGANAVRDQLRNQLSNKFTNYDQIVNEKISLKELVQNTNKMISDFKEKYFQKLNQDDKNKISKYFDGVTSGGKTKILTVLKVEREEVKNNINTWLTQLNLRDELTGDQVTSTPPPSSDQPSAPTRDSAEEKIEATNARLEKRGYAKKGKGYRDFHFGDSREDVLSTLMSKCPYSRCKEESCHRPLKIKSYGRLYFKFIGTCYGRELMLYVDEKKNSLSEVNLLRGSTDERFEVTRGKGETLYNKTFNKLKKKYKLTKEITPEEETEYSQNITNSMFSIFEDGKLLFGWWGKKLLVVYNDDDTAKIIMTPKKDEDDDL